MKSIQSAWSWQYELLSVLHSFLQQPYFWNTPAQHCFAALLDMFWVAAVQVTHQFFSKSTQAGSDLIRLSGGFLIATCHTCSSSG
jgi:hypothetical protein